jgi:hypothetical protein
MNEFWSNFKNSAIAAMVIALITIFIVGCFKLIPGLKNMKNTGFRKAIYQGLSLVFSCAMAILYHLFVTKGTWNMEMLSFILLCVTTTNAFYPLYENLGLRAIVKKIVTLLIPSKSKDVNEVVDKVADTVEKTLTSQEVEKNQAETEKTGWLK